MKRISRNKSLLFVGVITFLLYQAASGFAQNLRVTGKVKDRNSGVLIPHVNILVLGTTMGTTTDLRGEFAFSGELAPQDTLVFSHVGYQTLKLTITDLHEKAVVLLEPKPVAMQEVEVQAVKDSPMTQEIPATVSTVLVEPVVAQAASDFGDFIQRDASVKIDETGSGQKFVSIRGSNADEVLVIYDGIRLNSANDNTFDLAQIDLANLEKVEIIKGSNTVLFGEGAFGGVVNIVPRKIADYYASASQRLGTFSAKALALNLHRQAGKVAGAYAFSYHEAERQFEKTSLRLFNQSYFHTLWGSYVQGENKLEARYLRYDSNSEDPLLLAKTEAQNNVFSLVYDGALLYLKNLKLSAIRKGRDENVARREEATQRTEFEEADDRATFFKIEKQNEWSGVNLTLSYEHSRNRFDGRLSLAAPSQPAPLLDRTIHARRQQNSFFGIIKNRLDMERSHFRYVDWDLSVRIDWVSSNRNITFVNPPDQINGESGKKAYINYKIGLKGIGQIHNWRYNIYVLSGANIKLPTLRQLFYFDLQPQSGNQELRLDAEQNIGTEVGFNAEKDFPNMPTMWRIRKIKTNFAFFRNGYLDKITEITIKGAFPRLFNTNLARTTGFESRLSLELFDGVIGWDSAFLAMHISDPRVFKFKPQKKITTDLWLRRGNTVVNGHFFYEGKQNALILALAQPVTNTTLPARWDIDLSFQRTIVLKGLEGFFNVAVRNLRDSGRSEELSGFFLQDRRWYVSLGIQL
jgi:outer membrane cobalamin receptor